MNSSPLALPFKSKEGPAKTPSEVFASDSAPVCGALPLWRFIFPAAGDSLERSQIPNFTWFKLSCAQAQSNLSELLRVSQRLSLALVIKHFLLKEKL